MTLPENQHFCFPPKRYNALLGHHFSSHLPHIPSRIPSRWTRSQASPTTSIHNAVTIAIMPDRRQ